MKELIAILILNKKDWLTDYGSTFYVTLLYLGRFNSTLHYDTLYLLYATLKIRSMMLYLIHIISFLYLFVPIDKQDALLNAHCRFQLGKISLKFGLYLNLHSTV